MHRVWSGILTVTAACRAGCGGPGPADEIERFLRLMDQGECAEASEMIGGQMRMLGTELLNAACAERSREMSQRGGLESVEILSEDVQGNTATVVTRTTYGDGSSSERENLLTRLDGVWMFTPDMSEMTE